MLPYTEEDSLLINSGEFNSLGNQEAQQKMAVFAEEKGFGKPTITFRLKDWGVSRQRYWGTPIPMLYCEKDGIVPVPDDQLPVLLPDNVEITQEGGSPLGKIPEFVNATCPKCGGPARRETDTMDTFVDSSWYFYRYTSAKYDKGPFDPTAIQYWFPIDQYIGGVEHAILHLIYSRFWTKVMRDLGLINRAQETMRPWRHEAEGDRRDRTRGDLRRQWATSWSAAAVGGTNRSVPTSATGCWRRTPRTTGTTTTSSTWPRSWRPSTGWPTPARRRGRPDRRPVGGLVPRRGLRTDRGGPGQRGGQCPAGRAAPARSRHRP